jgi:hypothetical protein
LAALPLAAICHPLVHAPPLERLDLSARRREEYEALSALCRTAPGPVLSEMASMAVLRARPDALADLAAMNSGLGPAARASQRLLERDIRERRFALAVMYTGFHHERAFVDAGVFAELQRSYEVAAVLPLARSVAYRPRRAR